jgi:hypothetical protein
MTAVFTTFRLPILTLVTTLVAPLDGSGPRLHITFTL